MFRSIKPTYSIAYGLIAGAACVALCVLIRPAALGANDGLSYFGVFRTTIAPYALGYFSCAFCYWQAAKAIGNEPREVRYLATALRAIAVLIAGLVFAPHDIVGSIHVAIGATLFFLELVLSAFLVAKVDSSWQTIVVAAAEFLSGVAAFYYLPRQHGLLLQMQVTYQVAFGLLVIRVFRVLVPAEPRPAVE